MPKIKDIPRHERPREKAILFGFSHLSDEEILALVIGSGCKNLNAIEIAHNLLKDSRGLFYLFNMSIEDFESYKGLGVIGSLRISACFEIARRYKISEINVKPFVDSSEEIFKKYSLKIATQSQEVLLVIVLNKKKEIIHEEMLYKGTENSVEYSTKNIMRCVLINKGHYFYIIHNHPSGDTKPSSLDIIMTSRVKKNSDEIGICLLDHIIITQSGYYSFADSEQLFK